jgi:hypothetical protein
MRYPVTKSGPTKAVPSTGFPNRQPNSVQNYQHGFVSPTPRCMFALSEVQDPDSYPITQSTNGEVSDDLGSGLATIRVELRPLRL